VPIRFEGLLVSTCRWTGARSASSVHAGAAGTRYFLACRSSIVAGSGALDGRHAAGDALPRPGRLPEHAGLVPWVLVFDNMKTVTSVGMCWSTNLDAGAAAVGGEYGFHPRLRPGAGNQKGASNRW